MKRKTAALMLSMTLCVTMVSQVGAAALADTDLLTSGELTSEADPTVYEEPDASEPAAPEAEAEPAQDSLLLPETTPEQEITPAQEVQPEEIPVQDAQPDAAEELGSDELTAGEAEAPASADLLVVETEEIPTVSLVEPETDADEFAQVFADGSIQVGANSWVKTAEGYKLKRPATPKAGTEAEEIPAVQENEEEIPEVGAEPAAMDAEQEQAPETVPEADASEEAAEVGADSQYFTREDGILQITTKTVKGSHTGYYLFDDKGIMITGRTSIKTGTPGYAGSKNCQMYFAKGEDAALYSEYSGVEKTPVTSNLGQRKTNFWKYEVDRFYYYDKNGVFVSMKEVLASLGNPRFVKIKGAYYYIYSSGVTRKGLHYIDGDAYYLDPDSKIPGAMYVNKWKSFVRNNETKWMFFQGENAGEDRGKAKKHTMPYITRHGGKEVYYLLNKDGYVRKNKMLKTENGQTYCSDGSGRIYKDKLVKYGNYRYYFKSNGALAPYKNCWVRLGENTGKRFFYFGNTAGRVEEKHGYQKVTKTNGEFLGWFYFPESGNHYCSQFKEGRYFRADGYMLSGRQKVNGKYYIFEPSTASECKGKAYRNTMVRWNDRWYYAQSDGVLFQNGWIKIDGNWYFFKNFNPKVNCFEKLNGVNGYLDNSGIYRTGWVVVSNSENKVRYVDPNGNSWYKNTNVVINGLRYYFDYKGYRINDLTHIYTGNYYVTVDRVNGVCTVYDSTRTVPVKSIRVSVGAAGTETPLGTYYLSAAGRWQLLMGPSYGQYGTHVVGAGLGGIFFHSIPCNTPSYYGVPYYSYSILGRPASHGCIRCCVADAKFIYQRCNGSTVRIFDGTYNKSEALKGPLGRRALVPMTSNYDPTDPAIVG